MLRIGEEKANTPMSTPAPGVALQRAAIEALLRARKLDRTLTTAAPAVVPDEGADDQWPGSVVSTGLPALDVRLGGGLRRGQISEIVGPRSSGRTSLLMALAGATTRRGELAAFVDTLDGFDPASAAAAGVELTRLLWVRGAAAPGEAQARAIDRALKAANLLLQAGDFSLVALDLADVPPRALQRIPFTTWPRLQRVIEGGRTAFVLLGADHIARGPGGVTIALEAPRGRWAGTSDRARLLRGVDVRARIIRARVQDMDAAAIEVMAEADALGRVRAT
jgi:recombination protein RecA